MPCCTPHTSFPLARSCSAGDLHVVDCEVEVCGAMPNLAAVTVCGLGTVLMMRGVVISGCPYAGVAVYGPCSAASLKEVRL